MTVVNITEQPPINLYMTEPTPQVVTVFPSIQITYEGGGGGGDVTASGTNTFTGSNTFTGGLSSSTTTLTSNTAISGSLNLTTANITGLSSSDISDWYTEGTNPASATVLRDDFIGTGNETGEVGGLMWQYSGLTVGGVDAVSGRPGIVLLTRTSTTGIFFSAASSQAGVAHTDDIEYFCFIFKDGETDTVTTRRIGLTDSAASPTKFIGLVKANGSGDWVVDGYDSTPTGFPTVTAIVGDTEFHKVEFAKIGVNTWVCTVDGSFVATVTSTDAPVGSLLPFISLNGSTTTTMSVDFFSMRIGGTAR